MGVGKPIGGGEGIPQGESAGDQQHESNDPAHQANGPKGT